MPSKHLGAISDLHRNLAPGGLKRPGPPAQAVVKWYNPDSGFGFVQLADGSDDAFLHVSVLERNGHDSVPPGATLEVRADPSPRGHK
jgi:cold shock protein